MQELKELYKFTADRMKEKQEGLSLWGDVERALGKDHPLAKEQYEKVRNIVVSMGEENSKRIQHFYRTKNHEREFTPLFEKIYSMYKKSKKYIDDEFNPVSIASGKKAQYKNKNFEADTEPLFSEFYESDFHKNEIYGFSEFLFHSPFKHFILLPWPDEWMEIIRHGVIVQDLERQRLEDVLGCDPFHRKYLQRLCSHGKNTGAKACARVYMQDLLQATGYARPARRPAKK